MIYCILIDNLDNISGSFYIIYITTHSEYNSIFTFISNDVCKPTESTQAVLS